MLADPDNSISITRDAIEVLVAPANKFPSIAPITNNGVTSPPWSPTANVNDVNSSFIINALLSKSKLIPRYTLVPSIKTIIIIIMPPIKLFSDVLGIFSANNFLSYV